MRPIEPWFRRIEPVWNMLFVLATAFSGFPATVNADTFDLTYEYGSRYEKRHSYEPDIYLPFAASVRPNMTVFDIGAHVGLFSLAAALRVGTGGKVVAFEPSPETLVVLRKHVALNGWRDRIAVEPVVVSDRPGTITFYTHHDSMAASLSLANVVELNVQHPKTVTPVTVPTVTLDDYCRERGLIPDVLKIDVEGAELRVLRGAEQTLRHHSPVIWCEIHPMQMQNMGDDIDELKRYLADVGYVLEPI
ncbi:MAG: FkbM family methyltransferase, partial [Gemmatimonadaceae bacterium]